MKNKDKKPTPSQRPVVDLEALILEEITVFPPMMPLDVRAAEEYFQLLAKPFSYFEQQ
ncbi:hypothetical protein HZC53_04495 [Candidatus Uhrbacteria bacterium]|nr:hypothetical protein [Candidatus Uhrbacteria bacterium]